jgi:hypothetical protein
VIDCAEAVWGNEDHAGVENNNEIESRVVIRTLNLELWTLNFESRMGLGFAEWSEQAARAFDEKNRIFDFRFSIFDC